MVVRWLLVIAGWVLLETRPLAAANGGLVLPISAAGQQAAEGATVQLGKLDSPCNSTDDCSKVASAVCDLPTKRCKCSTTFPVNIGQDECVQGSQFNQSCSKTEQCVHFTKGATCKKDKETSFCLCPSNHKLTNSSSGTQFCKVISENKPHPPAEEAKVDVTMLAVLISLAVMFIIMCIVLRMFSKAQFRDQRTIFNSPRLMKKSLSKARAERRPSHVSVGSRAGSRAGSRHASIQSGLNIGGSRESIALPNSNSMKRLSAPIAVDDDTIGGSPKSPTKGEDSPHVAIKLSNDNIASV